VAGGVVVAAVLAPTDPVFAAAIVGREEVPGRLRHLLNVESGLNDGLALPVVMVLLADLAVRALASVAVGLIVLHSDAAGRDVMFHLIPFVVVLSILAQRVSRRRT